MMTKILRALLNVGSEMLTLMVMLKQEAGIRHCHKTGNYRDSAHKDCNVNVQLNQKIIVVFHNLEKYVSHFIMQELEKFDLK